MRTGAVLRQSLDRSGQALVAENGRVDAVSELPQLGDRLAELGLGLVEARGELAVLVASEPRAQEPQCQREADEPLLSAVVKVALEPPALGVARLDDAGARRAEILQLRARLGLQALVLEREARRRGDLLDELRIVEKVGPVEQERDGPAVANERRRGRPSRGAGSTARPRASA